MGIGPWEIVVLLIVLVIIFGAGRLSQVGGAVGRSVREFRSAVQDEPAVATVVAPPVICGACQASNLASNHFCSTCGASLSAPATASAAAPLAAAPTEATHGATVAATAAAEADHPVSIPPVAPVVAPTPTNTCPSCATVNPPGQPFCGQCGTRLGTAAA